MKLRVTVIGIMGTLFMMSLAVSAESMTLKTQKEKVSYSLGSSMGRKLKQEAVDIDPDILAKGLKDAFSGAKSPLSDEEMQTTLMTLQKEMAAKQAEKIKILGEKNKKEGEAFLTENKKKEGVKTLASGLQYKVLKEGTGKIPKPTDKVSTHYQGTLIDGTEFDSSYKRGEPMTFPVKGVIPGWSEALQKMKVGSKWQLFLPAKLAYGERGAPPFIGPNAVLIFTMELLAIQ
jgi:FKBP-type peptidyl-prolyl cis-trans isomerase FklB